MQFNDRDLMDLTINQILQQGKAAHKKGKFEEAERFYREILKTQPIHPDANHNLGLIVASKDKIEEALLLFKIAIEVCPKIEQFWISYVNLLIKDNQFEKAEVISRKVIELNPDFVSIIGNLGIIFHKLGKLVEAEIKYKKVIELKPDDAVAHNNLGIILQTTDRLEEAETSYKKAIKFKADYAEAHNHLGSLQEEYGRLGEAEGCYQTSIKLKPNYIDAHFNLSKLKSFNKEDEHYIQMQNLYLDENLTNEERCLLSFALAWASEELNKLDKSFEYYSVGNQLCKDSLTYDIQQDIKLFDQLKKSHLEIKKKSLGNFNLTIKPRLIFILGMPRSGTTLIEQIISSHSEVKGAGELPYIHQFGDSIARGTVKLDKKILLDFRKNYLNKIKELSNDHSIITDKMTLNFKYIGLICSVFPDAKIVHVKRNPMATCWGIYKQFFSSKKFFEYSYDLNNLVAYHNMYQDLMQFWEVEYGKRIYKLNYEALTMNQEQEIKKLIQYLELKWEPACLTPQNNKRNVKTRSSNQVRHEIYQGSSQKWKKFEPFFKGVFNQLND